MIGLAHVDFTLMDPNFSMRLPSRLELADGRSIALPAVMGVLNVTPDSFSDGGRFMDTERALEHALAMEAEGAAIIDVGGESTRPHGAHTVLPEVELARVTPVLELLQRKLRVPISIDTRKAIVAEAALRLGVAIVNDVSALSVDPQMATLVARAACPVVLMHMRGGPEDHVHFARYDDVVGEVISYLEARAQFALEAGVQAARIILDPGLGFAKTAQHTLELLGHLRGLVRLGYPLLIGASRKRFVRKFAGENEASVEAGNAAANAIAIFNGASIIRVHQVAPAVAAMKLAAATRDTQS